MRRMTAYLVLLLILAALAGVERSRRAHRPAAPVADSCTVCHVVQDAALSPGHDATAMGCSPCHLGNGQAHDKDRAHHGMVRNPGDLRTVEATCGRGGCHPALTARVKTSVMATASGMLGALDVLWGTTGPRDAAAMWAEDAPRDPPRDYWAKLCAACHLWWPKGRGGGEQRLRGGGCSACHVAGPQQPPPVEAGSFRHARLTMLVPMENCVRCHNRSARIGLSYQGLAEDDGSGGPHAGGALNPLRLSGGRFAMRVEPDVHHEAGMICIDCHTGTEIMGDGTPHPRLRDQLDVACADCHAPRFSTPPAPGAPPGREAEDARVEGRRLAAMNPALPPLDDAPMARTAARGSPLYALRLKTPPRGETPGQAVLLRKSDGKALPIALHSRPQPHHALRGHERLSCQACHSPLMPQCYGCHVTLDATARQRDLILGRDTPGRWTERLDYSRLHRPALGLRGGTRVAPFSPCQVFVSAAGPHETPVPTLSRAGMIMSPFDPHSTRTRSRTCLDCHLSPKTLGLGTGLLYGNHGPAFRPTYGARAVGQGGLASPEAALTPGGEARNGFPGTGDRPLNRGELKVVLGVAPCLPCHDDHADPVYRDFRASRLRLGRGGAPRCACPEPARSARRHAPNRRPKGDAAVSSNTH